MYPPSYIRYLNLPALPSSLIDTIPKNLDAYEKVIQGKKSVDYVWTDSNNHAVDVWCKKNICNPVYFAYQIISGNLVIHKDQGTKTKFIYLLESGGPDVWTEFLCRRSSHSDTKRKNRTKSLGADESLYLS